MSRSVSPKRLDDEASAGWTTYGTSRAAFSLFQGLASDVEDSSEKRHGVQALACRLGPLENGSHKLKLELHAFFHSFRASQRDMKAPQNSYPTPGILPTCTSASELQSDATLEASQTQAAAQRMRRRPNPNYGFSRVFTS